MSEKERDEWTSEIRSAKQQLLISLNATNPNSTLTSSASTNHVRRILKALPYQTSDEPVATLKTASSVDLIGLPASPLSSRFSGKKDKDKRKQNMSRERRRKVEHWVPPIWIPDSKTSSCMRCGRMFGWRRRRHHCRLCGRCICAACSSKVRRNFVVVFFVFTVLHRLSLLRRLRQTMNLQVKPLVHAMLVTRRFSLWSILKTIWEMILYLQAQRSINGTTRTR